MSMHACMWPGCQRQVPGAMWGCKPHWFALPRSIRADISSAYVPGQGVGDWSDAYKSAIGFAETYASEVDGGTIESNRARAAQAKLL